MFISDISRYDVPVWTALVRIGRPVVPAMIENIETSDNRILREKSIDVLYHVLGGKRRVLELLTKLKEQAKDLPKTECIEFLEKWCEERNCSMDEDEDLACEKQAFINTVAHLDIMEVNGMLLRINGEVSAFGITSHLTDDMGALQFEKALVKIKGLYQYLDNLCAKNLLKGYKFTNKESDMSLPGLARAKKSYHPVMMVKSYKMTVR